MNILYVHNATGSRLYRIIPQAKHMQSKGHDCRIRGLRGGKTGTVKSTDLEWSDVVVLQMTYSPSFLRAIRAHGSKIVYEVDDLMQKVSKKHYAHKDMNWWRTYLTYWCLMHSDAVTVTNDYLYDTYKWFNKNVYVLPNYLDMEFWDKPIKKNESDTIRMGWIGGTSHTEDLEWITPVLKKILTRYPQVKFISTGLGGTNSEDAWVEYNYGKSLFKDLPSEQYEFSLGAPMEVFPNKISSLRLDIGIAPVVENVFARGKTPCKALEYGLFEIPGVYSKFLYERHNAVIDGLNGFLVPEDHEAWFDRLSYLIDNEVERKKMGKTARLHVQKRFDFKDHAQKWDEIFNDICSTTYQEVGKGLSKT